MNKLLLLTLVLLPANLAADIHVDADGDWKIISSDGAEVTIGSSGDRKVSLDGKLLLTCSPGIERTKSIGGVVVSCDDGEVSVMRNGIVYTYSNGELGLVEPKNVESRKVAELNQPPRRGAGREKLGAKKSGSAALNYKAVERELGVTQMGDDLKVALKNDVLFDYDSAVLSDTAVTSLKKVAFVIKEKGRGYVVVSGHTDANGGRAYNKELSEARARSVATWLNTRGGVSSSDLVQQGYGEDYPIAPNSLPNGADNPAGRAHNRRVEIVIQTVRKDPAYISYNLSKSAHNAAQASVRLGAEGARIGVEAAKIGANGARVGAAGADIGVEGARVGTEAVQIGSEGARAGIEGAQQGLNEAMEALKDAGF